MITLLKKLPRIENYQRPKQYDIYIKACGTTVNFNQECVLQQKALCTMLSVNSVSSRFYWFWFYYYLFVRSYKNKQFIF